MIEWQFYWPGWWRRWKWEFTRDEPDCEFYLTLERHRWLFTWGPLQVQKIWYEDVTAEREKSFDE